MREINTLHQKTESKFPRVEVPNLTEAEQEQLEAFRAEAEWKKSLQIGFLAALFRKCDPFIGVAKPKRKPTKHQRGIANARARSETIRLQRGMDEFAANTTPGGTWITGTDER